MPTVTWNLPANVGSRVDWNKGYKEQGKPALTGQCSVTWAYLVFFSQILGADKEPRILRITK